MHIKVMKVVQYLKLSYMMNFMIYMQFIDYIHAHTTYLLQSTCRENIF